MHFVKKYKIMYPFILFAYSYFSQAINSFEEISDCEINIKTKLRDIISILRKHILLPAQIMDFQIRVKTLIDTTKEISKHIREFDKCIRLMNGCVKQIERKQSEIDKQSVNGSVGYENIVQDIDCSMKETKPTRYGNDTMKQKNFNITLVSELEKLHQIIAILVACSRNMKCENKILKLKLTNLYADKNHSQNNYQRVRKRYYTEIESIVRNILLKMEKQNIDTSFDLINRLR